MGSPWETCAQQNARSLGILAAACCWWLQPVWAATPTKALTADAAELFNWVSRSRDNGGLPFMIIDKRQAHLWVFDGSGNLRGNAPVLLGVARGDHTVPGIGDKKLSEIKTRRTHHARGSIRRRGRDECSWRGRRMGRLRCCGLDASRTDDEREGAACTAS